jgi:hypothetical protein
LDTEVISAFVASNSLGTHVLSGGFVDLLPFIILIVVVNLALEYLYSITAFAPDYVLIILQKSCDHFLLQSLIGSLAQNFPHFKVCKLCFAPLEKTNDIRIVGFDSWPKTRFTDHVETLIKEEDLILIRISKDLGTLETLKLKLWGCLVEFLHILFYLCLSILHNDWLLLFFISLA